MLFPSEEQVERVARALALHEYDGGHIAPNDIERCVEDDMRQPARRKAPMAMARAAIAAMD